MYADQIDAQAQRSVKGRLDRKSAAGFASRRPISGKTQREDDDKWEHDLFEDSKPQMSNLRVDTKDLRLKLQRKSIEQAVRGSAGGPRDLREKLLGTPYSRHIESKPPPVRPRPAPEASKPPRKSVIAQNPLLETKAANSAKEEGSAESKKTTTVESVDNFLRSLDLKKYSITFQAEEVDMTALVHVSDDDLKAMGIPMGPRKKILLALGSRSDD